MNVDGRLSLREWSMLAAGICALVILVLLPLYVTRWDRHLKPVSLGPLRWLGLIPLCLGTVLGIWSATLLVTRGDGTPAPWDPPRRFVVAGPYQFVRHPMVLGACAVLLGEAVLAESMAIFLYWALVVALGGWYVCAIEERELERRFGDTYLAYEARVPRWLPRFSRGKK